MLIKRNARNVTFVGPVVIKFSWNVKRGFKEFLIGWRAFLHGLSVPHLWIPFFLIRPRVTLLHELPPECKLRLVPDIIRAVKQLSSIGIEHRELRHPERHIGIWRGKIVFIDFDRSRFSKRSRDVNKIREWVKVIESLYQADQEPSRKVQSQEE